MTEIRQEDRDALATHMGVLHSAPPPLPSELWLFEQAALHFAAELREAKAFNESAERECAAMTIPNRREEMAQAFERIAAIFRKATEGMEGE